MDINKLLNDCMPMFDNAETTVDTALVLRMLADILQAYPPRTDYNELLFNNKALLHPLVTYARLHNEKGSRIDIVLSSFKYIFRKIRKQLHKHPGITEKLENIADVFEVLFVGTVFSDHSVAYDEKINFLNNKIYELEMLHQNIINSSPLMIFITDNYGNITECNNNARKYFSIINNQPYPKLLNLFDYDYIKTDEFFQTYSYCNQRKIKLMNGTVFDITVHSLGSSKLHGYLIRLAEASSDIPAEQNDEQEMFSSLTKSELKICELVYEGMRNKEISTFMGIAEDTVKNHRKNIRNKLKLNNKKINLYYFLRDNFKHKSL